MKPSPVGRPLFAALIVLTLVSSVWSADDPKPDQPPAQLGKADEGVREVLKGVLDRKILRLSTDPESVADRFEFLLTLIVPAKGGAAAASSYIVARDKDSVAALVLSPRGDPFAYATQGPMAGFDLTDPGRLMLYGTGAPKFVLTLGEEKDNLDLEFSFLRNAEAPEVLVDLEALVRGALENAERATYDRKRKRVHLATRKADILIALPLKEDEKEFGISDLVVKSKAGLVLAMSDIRTGGERSAILGREKAAFERLGLPTRTVGEKEAPRVPLFVPTGFGRRGKEQEAIKRLRTLFPALPGPERFPLGPKQKKDESKPGDRADARAVVHVSAFASQPLEVPMNRARMFSAVLAMAAYADVAAAEDVSSPKGAVALADKDKHEHKEGEKHEHKEDEHKGEKKDLGKKEIGGYTVQVAQVGDVKAGEEAVFVITLSGGSGKPKAIRGWVGVESGERSIKSKAEDEEKEYHLHHEVSKPMPAKSMLWVEVETSAGKKKGSFALKK